MTSHAARQLLIEIARRDVGQREVSKNRAPWIKKLWPVTSYPEGYEKRAPYCAAGMVWVLKTFIDELRNQGELNNILGMTGAEAERWRCKSAGAWAWMDWAQKKGVAMFSERVQAEPGDFVVFDFSHIGLVVSDDGGSDIQTIEYNTNAGGSREGDGCWEKDRRRKDVQKLIRIL